MEEIIAIAHHPKKPKTLPLKEMIVFSIRAMIPKGTMT